MVMNAARFQINATANAAGSSPAAMSIEQSVGEPWLAARCRGVFPPYVHTFTSAFSCKRDRFSERSELVMTSLVRRWRYLCDQRAGHLEQVLLHSQVEGRVSALLLRCVDFSSALHQQAEAALAIPPHGQVERMKT